LILHPSSFIMNVDLNCDLGESFGPWIMGNDARIMQYISSANIACGFHAGDPGIMRETVRMALKHHVAIGAHPGFPDLQGFGRREIKATPEEVFAMTLYQIGALQAIARAEGGFVRHVKPHGALYNMAAKDRILADAIARAVRQADPSLLLFGLSGSRLIEAGKAVGLRTVSEVFADRSYQNDGSLTPRSQAGAVLEKAEDVGAQALQLVLLNEVKSMQGAVVSMQAETLCLHGDGPNALAFAQVIYTTLKEKKIEILAP
ncbi:MAG: 5-oxoprolinase subunit PxpA, partial [Saprospiraceae bacterium]|nr:5-oxoprolinase subunit PxpA [Saprospiraceae bacterium]